MLVSSMNPSGCGTAVVPPHWRDGPDCSGLARQEYLMETRSSPWSQLGPVLTYGITPQVLKGLVVLVSDTSSSKSSHLNTSSQSNVSCSAHVITYKHGFMVFRQVHIEWDAGGTLKGRWRDVIFACAICFIKLKKVPSRHNLS